MAKKGRKPGDGRGRLGGRQKGTPNKDHPLKSVLQQHSYNYFEVPIKAEDAEGKSDEWKQKYKGCEFTQFELDLFDMKPSDRSKAQLELLAYHTAKMSAISADMAVKDANSTFTDRLSRLAAGEDVSAPDEE